jgi:hypothetical protein
MFTRFFCWWRFRSSTDYWSKFNLIRGWWPSKVSAINVWPIGTVPNWRRWSWRKYPLSSLPDIVFPPPGEGEIVEDILEQILPEDDRSVSRSDSFQTLEGLTQAVLAGNAIQQKMLEVQLKMLAAVNKTNDQLVKVEVAIRRQRVLPPAPPPPVWNRSNRPYISRRNFTRSPTPDQIKLRSVVRRRSESPPAKKPRKH